MGLRLVKFVDSLDERFASLRGKNGEAPGSILNLFFHGLFRDQEELEQHAAYPQQETTVGGFDHLVAHLLDLGYYCASPAEMVAGLDPARRYFTLTFDDGYFNNSRAVPVLEKYDAHATIFVSARHVFPGRPFWWEALYAELRRQGRSEREIGLEMAQWNRQRTDEIEAALRVSLGPDYLQSRGEADRPFTAPELKSISRNRHISIGNHTANHAVLSAYKPNEIYDLIVEGQEILAQITGYPPVAIAYPNGVYSAEAIGAAERAGLKLGFTTDRRKEYVRKLPERRMMLGRFCVAERFPMEPQIARFRSDLMLGYKLERLKGAIRHRRNAPVYM